MPFKKSISSLKSFDSFAKARYGSEHTRSVVSLFVLMPSLTITAEAFVLSKSLLYFELAKKVTQP